MINCSIGICVFNEEKNVGLLLDSLLKQKLRNVNIDEILVISSGSTDGTNAIVNKYKRKHRKISLFSENKRRGKSSAVNFFVAKANSEILVLMGGDLILSERLIENLVREFEDQDVGMTGAHPVPVNDIGEGLAGYAVHFLWDLHHRVSLKNPKMGEVIAFRKIFKRIPAASGADEASIEPLIRGQGYKIAYVPKAVIYNKSPTSIKEFIRQRRRIYAHHLIVRDEQYYLVSTLNAFLLFRVLFSFLKENFKLKVIMLSFIVVLVEAYSRYLGWWDYRVNKRRHTIWEPIESTKEAINV